MFKYIDILVILWYIYTVCDPSQMSVLRTFLTSFLLGTSLGMPALAWEQETLATQQECIPQFSVSYAIALQVIVVEQQNTCQWASSDLVVHLADDDRELGLTAFPSQNYSGRWVTEYRPVAKAGQYRVMGIEYLNGRVAPPLDQRITIPGAQQKQSAPALPQVTLPLAPRQEVAPEQPPQVSLDDESKRLITSLLDSLQRIQELLVRFRDFLNTLSLG